jgi:hypothetical protein
MRWIEHIVDMGEKRNACRVWWEILKRPLGRPRHRGEIIGYEGIEWVNLAQDREQ